MAPLNVPLFLIALIVFNKTPSHILISSILQNGGNIQLFPVGISLEFLVDNHEILSPSFSSYFYAVMQP